MLPTRLLTSLIQELITQTKDRKANWQREYHDREDYILDRGQYRIAVRYHSARLENDVIEFSIESNQGAQLGKIIATEDDPITYSDLSELLYRIQRHEGRTPLKSVTDQLLQILPENQRKEWE